MKIVPARNRAHALWLNQKTEISRWPEFRSSHRSLQSRLLLAPSGRWLKPAVVEQAVEARAAAPAVRPLVRQAGVRREQAERVSPLRRPIRPTLPLRQTPVRREQVPPASPGRPPTPTTPAASTTPP